MDSKKEVGYAVDARSGYATTNRDDTPDHHTVSSLVNLLTNETGQLVGDIGELRARLTPVMRERNSEKVPTPGVPVSCKMAAELGDVFQRLSEARRLVSMTLSELDL